MDNFSRIGFILATLGSSIGLGHIWRFPYMAGVNGGGAFVLFYLFLAIVIGVSMLVTEMLIGNIGQSHAPANYQILDKQDKGDKSNPNWKWAGITIYGGPFILTFYAVVLGWVLYYLFIGSFTLPADIDMAKDKFDTLVGNSVYWQTAGFLATMGLTAWIVARGVKAGIEKANLVLMPLLFIIFIGLLIYAISMDSFSKSVAFMFSMDFSKLTPNVMLDALGQVFFSLSLGVGTIITYAAYAPKGDNLFSSSIWVVLSGLAVSLIGGLMIFTFIFEYGGEPAAGPGLLLVSLPLVFGQMNELSSLGLDTCDLWICDFFIIRQILSSLGLGTLISVLFFVAVIFAGITSTVSILEPLVTYFQKRFDMSKAKASYLISAGIVLVGLFVILSLNGATSAMFTFLGKNLFDIIDFITSSLIMPLGTLAALIFLGWNIKKSNVRKWCSFFNDGMFNVWYIIIKFIAPIVIIAILISKFASL